MTNKDKQPMHRLPDTIHRLLRTLTAATAVLLWIAGAAVAADATGSSPLDSAQFRADIDALLQHPHRMTGTPEGDAAIDHLRGRLQAIGPDRLVEQVFTFPQTVVEECSLSVVSPAAGRTVKYDLTPMRPNGVVPPATPAEGLTGELVYVGANRSEATDAPSLKDRIVVLEYASGETWRHAFREGAKAVIFVGGMDAPASTALSTPVSANLPRYYYAGNPEDLKGGGRATVRGRMRWARTTGRNLVALIRGRQPVFLLEKDEVVIFAARVDSFGEAPRQSPAARGAANCAALLQLAAHLKANPPRRNVAIVFFSGEARGHAGASAFYRALGSGTGEESVLLQERAASLGRERTYTKNMLEILGRDNPLATELDLEDRLRDILDDRIENRVRTIDVKVQDFNFEVAALQDTMSESQEVLDRIKALKSRTEELAKQKMRWNNLRRAIAQGTDATEYADYLHRLVEQVRDETVARQKELAEEEEALDSDRKVSQTFAEMWIGLHVSVNFDDTSRRWSFMAGGEADVRSAEDIPGLYGRINNTIRRAYEALVEDEAAVAPEHFEPAVVSGELSPARNMIAARYITQSGDIAGRLGIYNIIATTMQARFDREGTPGDVVEALQVDTVEAQVRDLLTLAPAILDREGLSTRSAIGPRNEFFVPIFSERNTAGVPRAMGKPKLGSLFNIPIQGAAVQLFHGQYHTPGKEIHQIPAYENYEVTITDANGCYAYGPVVNGSQHSYMVQGFGVKLDEQGLVSWASNSASDKTVYNRLNMNECKRGCAVLLPIPKPKDAVDVKGYDALANNAFEQEKSYLRTLDGITHWYCEDRVKAVKLFGLDQVVAVNNGPVGLRDTAEREDYRGKGFPMDPSWRPDQVALRTASDLWRLNEARMQIQRKRGVTNASIEELHGRVEDLMVESKEATAPQTAEALAISAAWGEEPVYTHTRSSLDDLVKAVLVLLALSVPFAFALERLLVGATTIYSQIGWFVVMFVLTFVALYLSHPAFAISNTPLIIFLGFAVVVLSSLVIIIMRKFEVE
ncbi:MAG: M28 family peptidase, partial [Planctomycetota bacterium]